jgi:hypothetical protein
MKSVRITVCDSEGRKINFNSVEDMLCNLWGRVRCLEVESQEHFDDITELIEAK